MKRNGWVWAVVALAGCALLLVGGTGCRKSLSQEEAYQRFVGTWVNTEYAGPQPFVQMLVVRSDHSGEDWLYTSSPAPDGVWAITPKKTWVDAQGRTYCQFFWNYTEGHQTRGVALMRVDQERKVFELNTKFGSENSVYPEEIDPSATSAVSWYFIYHRK